MTDGEVRKFIRENLDDIKEEFGLRHWSVVVSFEPLTCESTGFKHMMQVDTRYEYQKASIKIDPAAFDGEEEWHLRRCLEHEIMHIVHSPFTLVWDMAKEVMSDAEFALWHLAYMRAQEQTLVNMEGMRDRLRLTERVRVRKEDVAKAKARAAREKRKADKETAKNEAPKQ